MLKVVLCIVFLVRFLRVSVQGEPQVPCYFIFGDSLADSGNNNMLITTAKPNFPPYGVDFPGGVTGRFTNNRTIPDVIGQLLGFKDFIPPFTTITGDIMKGVNYASSVSGIRDESGIHAGDRVTLNEQLQNHLDIVSRITNTMKNASAAREYLGKCIYVVITGSNDYMSNYFLPKFYHTSSLYTPKQYADVLVMQYSEQLKRLYDYGARKVAVFGLGMIGQAPEVLRKLGAKSVAVTIAAQMFSIKLQPLVIELNSQLTGAKFTFIDTLSIIMTSSPSIDLLNLVDACCKTMQGICIPGSTPCADRSRYGFFDGFHPTDVVNEAFAKRTYKKVFPPDAFPYDFAQLAKL